MNRLYGPTYRGCAEVQQTARRLRVRTADGKERVHELVNTAVWQVIFRKWLHLYHGSISIDISLLLPIRCRLAGQEVIQMANFDMRIVDSGLRTIRTWLGAN